MAKAKMARSPNALKLLKLWQNKHHTHEIDYAAASKWADDMGHYTKLPISTRKQCEDEMRRAVKRATHTDKQGRKLKTYGSLPLFDEMRNKSYTQIDMRITSPDKATKVLDDEFGGMENDVRSHDTRRASYSDNNLFGATIEPYDYNLNPVLGAEYDDSYDEEDFQEED